MGYIEPMTDRLSILYVDFEFSYATYYAFPSKHPQYLAARQIKSHQSAICACWKWDGGKSGSVSVLDDPKGRDDYIVAATIHDIFEKADLIIAHNGDQYDIKMANTLFIKHGLYPISEKKTVDTLKVARRYFKFSGNGLDDLLRFFKLPTKRDKPDWIKITNGDAKEIRKCVRYCMGDVLGLERIYKKLRPYMKNHPCLKERPGKITKCEACGSENLRNKGGAQFNGKYFYHRIQCKDCGYNNKGSKVFVKEVD